VSEQAAPAGERWGWNRYLTERDRAVFASSGYGAAAALGDRPALLVIDVTYEFTGPAGTPILDALAEYPNGCGEDAWRAVGRMAGLIAVARGAGVPVIYTHGDPGHPALDRASWGAKNPRLMTRPPGQNDIVADIAPERGDAVIAKVKPSGFFGTPLQQYLTTLGVNQLICCGGTTSGCVRATVVDGFSAGYSVAVAADATFDRGEASHAMSLFDMNTKYANVMSSREIARYLDGDQPRTAGPTAAGGNEKESTQQ
jgi:nicotinamidase-related amidase